MSARRRVTDQSDQQAHLKFSTPRRYSYLTNGVNHNQHCPKPCYDSHTIPSVNDTEFDWIMSPGHSRLNHYGRTAEKATNTTCAGLLYEHDKLVENMHITSMNVSLAASRQKKVMNELRDLRQDIQQIKQDQNKLNDLQKTFTFMLSCQQNLKEQQNQIKTAIDKLSTEWHKIPETVVKQYLASLEPKPKVQTKAKARQITSVSVANGINGNPLHSMRDMTTNLSQTPTQYNQQYYMDDYPSTGYHHAQSWSNSQCMGQVASNSLDQRITPNINSNMTQNSLQSWHNHLAQQANAPTMEKKFDNTRLPDFNSFYYHRFK